MIKVTYYLEVISSWCYWVEQAWAELKRRYDGKAEFGWKIAQMPPEAYPQSKSQCEWFYRRSGSIMRSPFMLSAGINYTIWMVKNPAARRGFDVSQGIPTTYVLDRSGSIVRTYIGAKPQSVFENDVNSLL